MDVRQARAANLLFLIRRYKSLRAFADDAGVVPAHASQMKGGVRRMGDDIARRIEERLHLPHGWMDHEHADHIDGATVASPSILDPRHQVLIGLFDGLTEAQQEDVIRDLQAKKSLNDELLTQLLARRQAG